MNAESESLSLSFSFRDPPNHSNDYYCCVMMSEVASENWEDLEYDLRQLLEEKPEEEIVGRLRTGTFSLRVRPTIPIGWHKNGYDYELILSDHEKLTFHVENFQDEKYEFVDNIKYYYSENGLSDPEYNEIIELGSHDDLERILEIAKRFEKTRPDRVAELS